MKSDRNLDIMRAMAVLGVLIAHCFPASPAQMAAGHYAVLIFFVHTCLVLLLSLQRQAAGRTLSSPALPLRFYVQRAFRIYPLSVLCVFVTLVYRISWPDALFTPRSAWSITANLLLVQNFLHERYSVSPPLWSLPYEMQMYAVLPLLFLWLGKFRNKIPAPLVGLSIALPVLETAFSPLKGISITRYFPCFMGGAVAFSVYTQRRTIAWQWWPVAVCGFGVIYGLTGQAMFEDWLICLALGFVLTMFREVPQGLVSKAAALVARYSYGIYLAHAPLLWLCLTRLPNLSAPVRWSLFGVLVCVVPVILYHAVEKPTIGAGKAISLRLFRQMPELHGPTSIPLEAQAASAGH